MLNENKKEKYIIGITSVTIVAVIWEVLSIFKISFILNFNNMPGPLLIGEEIVHLLGNQSFLIDVKSSLVRVCSGWICGTLLGWIIAIFMNRNRYVRMAIFPLIKLIQPIPLLAYIPIFGILLSTTNQMTQGIIIISATFPVLTSVFYGMQMLSDELYYFAKSNKLRKINVLIFIDLPYSIKYLKSGAVIGISSSWMAVISAETLSGMNGIGYFIWEAFNVMNYTMVIAGVIVLSLLGMLSVICIDKGMDYFFPNLFREDSV